MSTRKTYTIALVGDVMFGRLIDQLLPTHVDEPSEARLVSNFRTTHPHLREYTHASPWGNAIPLLQSANLVLANLETSATTHPTKWPDKVFNYRMHPDNVRCLTEAGVDYVSLANNHTLDFGVEGLVETVRTIKAAGIHSAGAGESEVDAARPAMLTLAKEGVNEHPFQVFAHSFSDHPRDWRGVKAFNFIDYTPESRQRIKDQILAQQHHGPPALKVVSIHWGPNYAWHPSEQVIELAHFLVDECGLDIIHGHSSHHLQGVEVYNSKLIIYGCGDFVDDYAVHDKHRNDLSAVLKVTVAENSCTVGRLEIMKLEIFPNRIRHFQAGLLSITDPDHAWVCEKFRELCCVLGTQVERNLGDQGQMTVLLNASL